MRQRTVSVGLDVPAHIADEPARTYRELATAAEEAGFERLWVGDHLLWRKPRFETFALLSLLAGTTSLGLGTAVALAPLRPPWWLAKQAASVDRLSPGGCILGLGTGGEYEREFDLAGVPLSERGARLDAAIDHCRRAWSGLDGDDVSPRPPAPLPIWVGGRKGAALRRAAERADGWLGLFLTPEAFAEHRAALLARRPEHLAPLHLAMAVWTCVDDDESRARATGLSVIGEEYGTDPARFDRYVVAGTAEQVAGRLADYIDAGVEHLDIHLAHPDPRAQIDRWGSDVLPLLRAGAAA